MLDTLSSLVALAILLLAAYGAGQPLARWLRLQEDSLDDAVWSLCLGLVAFGLALMALGLAGLLHRPLIGGVTCGAAFAAVGSLVRRVMQATSPRAAKAKLSEPGVAEDAHGNAFADPPRWLRRGLMLLAALSCGGALVGALAPSTDGDALCYHLDLPKLFLLQQAIYVPEFNDHATFPLLLEMWYAWAMALDGGVAAQLVHWALGVLFALASVLLARGVLGNGWSWLVGCMVLLTPGISNQMAAPMNDAGLALLTTMALVAWRRGAVDGDGKGWFVAAGVMLGSAASVKYTALLFVLALGSYAGALVWRARRTRRELLIGNALAVAVAVIVASPWYARAVWHRGNPVYPFFSQHLGQAAPESLPEHKTPHGWDLPSLASMPWAMTMHPERFGGRGNQLGAMFLLALPGLFFARRLRGLAGLLLVAGVYFLLWYELRQNVRFLYPIVPMLSVAVVWVWIELRRMEAAPRSVGMASFALLALFGAAVPLVRSADQLAVASGWQSRDDYLLEREPSYAAATTANALLRDGARLLSQDYRNFYFQCDVVRESVYRRQTGYDKQLREPTELSRQLRADGFTHLLLAEATGPGIRFNDRLATLVARQQQAESASSFQQLIDYEIVDSDGALRRYRLVELR